MRFHAEHHFSGPVDAVVAVLVDPSFHQQLELPDLSLPEVVDTASGSGSGSGSGDDGGGDEAVLRLRYEYVGQLDPIARRLLGDRQLTWLQELRLDRSTGSGRLTFRAEAAPDRLNGAADFVIEGTGDGGSVRRLDGDLRVAIRPIGGMAERRILPGLLRRLDIEAQAVEQRLEAT